MHTLLLYGKNTKKGVFSGPLWNFSLCYASVLKGGITNMKKMIALFAGVVLTASMLVFPVSAAQEISVEFNGEIVKLDQTPVMENGRVLVPFKFFADTFGATTSWDAETKTVTCTYGETTISMTAHSQVMKLDGKNIAVEVPVDIINSKVMVPIRVIATSFGANVSWDSDRKTAVINTGDVHFNRINTAGNVSFTYAETASEGGKTKSTAKYPVFTGNFGSKVNTAISAQAKADIKAFEADITEGDDLSKCTFTSSYDVKCNNNGVVSIVNTQESYTGGAHGSTVVSAKTYCIEDGNVINIKSSDMDTAIEQFKELINANKENYFEDALDNVKAENIGWYVDKNENTVFFINEGVVAPYAVGLVTVTMDKNVAVEALTVDESATDVVADKTVSPSVIDVSKIKYDKLFDAKGNISVTTNVPVVSGNYATLNTTIKKMAQDKASAMVEKYKGKSLDETNSAYAGTINATITYADDSKVCVLFTENVRSGDKKGSTYVSALFLSAVDGSVVDDGTNAQYKEEGANLINEAVKNDKTGAFTQGATAKPEDVGYYFDNDGVIFFVNEGVVAPASSGLVTVERLN